MKAVKLLLPLLTNAMLLGMVVLVILELRNPYQGYLNSLSSRVYILVLCFLGLCCSTLYLVRLLRDLDR